MKLVKPTHRRHSLRLARFDYSKPGAYFVTICTLRHKCIFGEIIDKRMHLSKVGLVTNEVWHAMPAHFESIELDAFVIMPNHIHGILTISNQKESHVLNRGPLQPALVLQTKRAHELDKLLSSSLSHAIRSFKSAVTNHANRMLNRSGGSIWQRNYWEHVIRNEADLNRIREYIQNNPAQWQVDKLNRDPDY